MMTIKNTTFMFLISYLSLGCEKFVEVDIPPNQLSSENTFSDEASANAVVSGIYASMSTGFLSANMQFAMEYYSGDLIYNGSAENYMQFINKSIQVDNSLISSFWNGLYQYIYYCNSAILSLNNSNLNQDFKNDLTAECLFIRAFSYSYLVKYWGGVPLILTTDWQVNQSLERSTENAVYDQIVSDLEQAKLLFQSNNSQVNTRANYYSTVALLSRIYFLLEEWEKVEENAGIVISNTSLMLENISNIFLSNSKETIFQLTSIDPSIFNTNIGQQIIPWSSAAIPTVEISKEFLQKFSEDDLRVSSFMKYNLVQNLEHYYPFKYKEGLFSTERKENLVVLRLAEQYFNRSMARLELGSQDDALNDLNFVLNRLTQHYFFITQETLLKEKQKEFFAEWDIASTNVKKSWPIPLSQIESNPYLTQNEGY